MQSIDWVPYWLLATFSIICDITKHAISKLFGVSIVIPFITVPFSSMSCNLIKLLLQIGCTKYSESWKYNIPFWCAFTIFSGNNILRVKSFETSWAIYSLCIDAVIFIGTTSPFSFFTFSFLISPKIDSSVVFAFLTNALVYL